LIFNYLYVGNNRLARFNGSAKEYYVNDIRGSVVKVISSSGIVSSSFEYEPFGSISRASGNPVEFNYTGKEFDDAYGFDLYYYGARYYDAALGRFISPDPVREYLNPYSYVGNEPVMHIDLNGEFGLPWPAVYNRAVEIGDWVARNWDLISTGYDIGKELWDRYHDDVLDGYRNMGNDFYNDMNHDIGNYLMGPYWP
jgi:RHS repeat-associated protein